MKDLVTNRKSKITASNLNKPLSNDKKNNNIRILIMH